MGSAGLDFVGKDESAIANPQAAVDIVFVHGLNGDRITTWSTTDFQNNFWPAWLAQDVTSANVWTMAYDSSPFASALAGGGSSLGDSATILLDFLTSNSLGKRPILFVTHSLGGLLVKQMLRICHDVANLQHTAILDATKAIVFCGTPHGGAALATTIAQILRVFASKHIRDSAIDHETLLDTHSWFRNLVFARKIRVVAYYETKKTAGGWGLASVLVVPKAAADPGIVGCLPIAIEADHIAICKPATRQAQLYMSTKSLVLKLISSNESEEAGGELPIEPR